MPKITSKPYHYLSSDGFHMYVGKNNYQNEELTFKVANGNDWWFHAKGIPGSHVIVKTEGKELPVDLNGQIIFYAGPAPQKPGQAIGSIGPTTSYRMDPFAPILMEKVGLKGMIGKGKRNDVVKEAICKYKGVYFGATGGVAALLGKCVKQAEVILYPELGPEAIRRLELERFPVIVINDAHGGDLYQEEMKKYNEEI